MAGNYGDTSIDAVPSCPFQFLRYLKRITDRLLKKDVSRLCFLCRDLIPAQDLEAVSRALTLFNELKKQMLISADDVSFLIELLEAISRKDLVKEAMTWHTNSTLVGRQSKISRYRLFLFDLAVNSTKKELDDMKCMVSGHIANNLDEIVDTFQFLTELEKHDVISAEDVSKLHDIMSNKQLLEKVRHYEAYCNPYQGVTTRSAHPTSQAYGVMNAQHTAQPTSQMYGAMNLPTKQHFQNLPAHVGHTYGVMPAQATTLPKYPASSVSAGLEHQFETLKLSHQAPKVGTTLAPAPQHGSEDPANEGKRANLATVLASIDTFPPEGGQATRDPQHVTIPPDVEEILQFDHPDTDECFVSMGSWNSAILNEGPMPHYPMESNPRGLCLIINNMEFKNATKGRFSDRKGSDIDACRLVKLFMNLRFSIRCVNNQSAGEMYNQLAVLRLRDHTKYDCFVCCILTHGDLGMVYGCDGNAIEIQELTGLFTGVKCPSLVGKPKIFFIQACQGKKIQQGVAALQTDNLDQPVPTIPNDQDFLVGYSTVPGYASFRSPSRGSLYMSILVEAIQLYHEKIDMLNLLVRVNDLVGKCSDKDGRKQSSTVHFNLTKVLRL